MSFSDIKGNNRTIERIQKSVANGIISHAYIFEGDSCTNKMLAAETFVKAILCESPESRSKGDCCDQCTSCHKIEHGNHEDVIYIGMVGNSIKDEEIENLQGRIKKKPFGNRTIVIIESADAMTLRAQNRLLKTLEEPIIGAVIILLSENVENLVQTVRSRCIHYKLTPYQEEVFLVYLALARKIETMLLEKKSFFSICEALKEIFTDKQNAYLFLDALESWYRDIGVCEYDQNGSLIFHQDFLHELNEKSRIYRKTKIFHAVECIEEARKDLNRNINTSYTLKNMILKIGG